MKRFLFLAVALIFSSGVQAADATVAGSFDWLQNNVVTADINEVLSYLDDNAVWNNVPGVEYSLGRLFYKSLPNMSLDNKQHMLRSILVDGTLLSTAIADEANSSSSSSSSSSAMQTALAAAQAEISRLRVQITTAGDSVGSCGTVSTVVAMSPKITSELKLLSPEVQAQYRSTPGLVARVERLSKFGADVTKHLLRSEAEKYDYGTVAADDDDGDDDSKDDNDVVTEISTYEKLEEEYGIAIAQLSEEYRDALRDMPTVRAKIDKQVLDNMRVTSLLRQVINKDYLIKTLKAALKVPNNDQVKKMVTLIGKFIGRGSSSNLKKVENVVAYKKLPLDLFKIAGLNIIYLNKLVKYLDSDASSGVLNDSPVLVEWLTAVFKDTAAVLSPKTRTVSIHVYYKAHISELPNLAILLVPGTITFYGDGKIQLRNIDEDAAQQTVRVGDWANKAFTLASSSGRTTSLGKAVANFNTTLEQNKVKFESRTLSHAAIATGPILSVSQQAKLEAFKVSNLSMTDKKDLLDQNTDTANDLLKEKVRHLITSGSTSSPFLTPLVRKWKTALGIS
jgi:hypothetical protein